MRSGYVGKWLVTFVGSVVALLATAMIIYLGLGTHHWIQTTPFLASICAWRRSTGADTLLE